MVAVQTSERMRSLLAKVDLSDISRSDLPPGFDKVVDGGWEREADGAWVLRALRSSYHGPREEFSVSHWEEVVNGRGIPDDDLDPADPRRTEILARRTWSYVQAVLARVADLDQVPVVAFATLSETWTEDPILVAHATFWVHREDDLLPIEVDPTDQETAMMLINSWESPAEREK